ncbi:MAG: serine/threonine-protein kinase, partial [Gemmataceae bacterium]
MNEETLSARVLNTPPDERAALLDRECAGNPTLRARVEAFLADHTSTLSPVAESAATLDGTDPYIPQTEPLSPPAIANMLLESSSREASARAGVVVAGKYTLLETIGEGGMGSVWRAKQSEPVKRFVALKLIKAGMDSKQVMARFEAERQALALMDHPNIAKVLDGGLHDGRPYFVMELVNGVPITDYCDAQKLTPQARLELFVNVCQAIQHAHQKGIIHRDIKPSNVMVALYDDKPVVKVIDFGVAKATGGSLTEHSIDTGFGGVVGTPQYMSPEQATFNNLDIDTRSDVYALGVLLYELLAGSPPFSGKELQQKGLLEILRVVREEEPPRPSEKLSTADALPSLSADRGTDPKKLTGLLRNELDWIVMKALEKDRTRRYETANGFAADVQRYLAGEAVLAHPPSTAYRIKKFVRRHRGQVIAASLIFFALLAGIAGTTIGLFEAKKQERLAAERAEGERVAKLDAQEKEKLAQAAAEKERIATELTASRLTQIETINNTVFDIFTEFDIRKVKQGKDPVEYVLAQKLIAAGKKLDEMAIQDPLVLANLQHRLGRTLLSLGEAPAAIELLRFAVASRKANLGPDHPDTLTSMGNLASAYQAAGKLDQALPLLEETFK